MSFGATPATSFTVNSADADHRGHSAHSAGTVSVTVTTVGGTSNGVAYTYVAVPTLTTIVAERRSGDRRHDGRADRDESDRCDRGEFRWYTGDVVHRELVDADHRRRPCRVGRNGAGHRHHRGRNQQQCRLHLRRGAHPHHGGTERRSGDRRHHGRAHRNGLTGATAVSFGGTPATSFTVNSVDADHRRRPPRSAGTVSVTVTTVGRNQQRCRLHLRRGAHPHYHHPERRSGGGGTTVVLTGTNLTGATAVSFGGTPAASFTVDSVDADHAVTPAESAGTVSVTVTTVGGTSNGVAYTYVAVPTLTTITPNAGPVTGGTTVVLTGRI